MDELDRYTQLTEHKAVICELSFVNQLKILTIQAAYGMRLELSRQSQLSTLPLWAQYYQMDRDIYVSIDLCPYSTLSILIQELHLLALVSS